MEACSAGPMLELLADLNDKDLLVSSLGDLSEEVILEKGDHIFAVSLLLPSMDIQATSTISQCSRSFQAQLRS